MLETILLIPDLLGNRCGEGHANSKVILTTNVTLHPVFKKINSTIFEQLIFLNERIETFICIIDKHPVIPGENRHSG